jgi:ankyrin repeat protein
MGLLAKWVGFMKKIIGIFLLTVSIASRSMDIFQACEQGDIVRVRELAARDDVDVKERDKWNRTALHIAASCGCADIVEILLNKGCPIDALDSDGYTALHRAVLNGHGEVVKLLLDRHPVINPVGRDRFSALHRAVVQGKLALVSFLLNNGVKVDEPDQSHGLTPLYHAAVLGNIGVVRCLLDRRASANFSYAGITVLHAAVSHGKQQVAELLLSFGTDLNPIVGENGLTSLHHAAVAGDCDFMEFLFDRRVPVDVTTSHDATPLCYAAFAGNIKSVEFLIKHGASVGAMDDKAYTALHYALLGNRPDVVDLLLKKGASINAVRRDGLTSLHAAALNGHENVIKFLLEHQVSPDTRGPGGCTALHCAAKEGHANIVVLLLQRGAAVNVCDDSGHTAFQIAAATKHTVVSRILAKSGGDKLPGATGGPCVDAAGSGGQVECSGDRTKFLHSILGVKLSGKFARLQYAKSLNDAANFLYLQHLWAESLTRVWFLCEELKKLGYSLGDVHRFTVQSCDGSSSCPVDEASCCAHQKCVVIKTMDGIVAGWNLAPFLVHEPFIFNEPIVGLIDSYLQQQHEEVQRIAHAVKCEYLAYELKEQFGCMLKFASANLHLLKLFYGDRQCFTPVVGSMEQSFVLAGEIVALYGPSPDSHDTQKISSNIYSELESLMGFIEQNHDRLARIYELILSEKKSQNKQYQGIQCSLEYSSVRTLPDLIHWAGRISSFGDYFRRCKDDESQASACQGQPEDAAAACAAQSHMVSGNGEVDQLVAENKERIQRGRCAGRKQKKQHKKGKWPMRGLGTSDARQRVSHTPSSEDPAPSPAGAAPIMDPAPVRLAEHVPSSLTEDLAQLPTGAADPTMDLVPANLAKQVPLQDHKRMPSGLLRGCAQKVKQKAGQRELHQSILGYDKRVLRWFDRGFAQTQPEGDVLYHAFPICADTFIMGRGIISNRPNRSHPQKIDTCYSLPGEVRFADGRKRFAIFTCTLDQDGYCYHRGITYKSLTDLESILRGSGLDYRDLQQTYTQEDKVTQGGEHPGDVKNSRIVKKDKLHVEIEDVYNRVAILLYRLKKDVRNMF